MKTIDRQTARQLDKRAMDEFGVPGIVLMENAGRGVADTLLRLGAQSPVAICCGKGNNAGDGFVIARHLDARGVDVRVLVWAQADELRGDAAVNYRIVQRSGIFIEHLSGPHNEAALDRQLAGAEWLVDALLGTGAHGAPRPPLDKVIDQMNRHPAPILAVDLPSGLDCDTGEATTPTIRAAHTCTFVAGKPGFAAPGAGQYTGQVHIIDIGVPRRLVAEVLGG